MQSFPDSIPSLTIDVGAVLIDPTVVKKLAVAQPIQPIIHSVHFAPEALECAVALVSGDLVVYRVADAPVNYTGSTDSEIIVLSHLPSLGSRFVPLYLLASRGRQLSACALCDIGNAIPHCALYCS